MNRTAYLLVILDENGQRKSVGIYSEENPTMRFGRSPRLAASRAGGRDAMKLDQLEPGMRNAVALRAELAAEGLLRGPIR